MVLGALHTFISYKKDLSRRIAIYMPSALWIANQVCVNYTGRVGINLLVFPVMYATLLSSIVMCHLLAFS